MLNPVIMATAGWSEAVEVRARKLLSYEIGAEPCGTPVTIATMIARGAGDPLNRARWLMCLSPRDSWAELTATLGHFTIDGATCPEPRQVAYAALTYAGRALPADPDLDAGEKLVRTVRRWLSQMLSSRQR